MGVRGRRCGDDMGRHLYPFNNQATVRTLMPMPKDELIKLLVASFIEGASWCEQYELWNDPQSSEELHRAVKTRAKQYAKEIAG